MKKIFMLAAAAATLFAVSCNRAQGPEALVEEEDNSPVAVKFSTNAAVVSGVTKAAIDDWSATETLYIYGIDKEGNKLIDNVAALSPAAGADEPAAIDVWDTAYAPNKVPFFYGTNGEVYDFYGYYVGDAIDNPEPVEDEEEGGLTLEVGFNGTQDLMLAKADATADYGAHTDFNPNVVYSAKAARKGVQPNLVFKHQLSRFEFQLKFVELPESTKANQMTIDGISLTTPSALATMDILNSKTTFDNQSDVFDLYDEDGQIYTNGAIFTDDFHKVGESIMVAPGASVYTMKMFFTYKYIFGEGENDYVEIPYDGLDEEGHYPAFSWDIDLPALLKEEGYKAEAGKKYIVKLIVYGPAQVEVSVTLEDWDVVELEPIDPDYDPEYDD